MRRDFRVGLGQKKRRCIWPKRGMATARVRESSDSGTAFVLARPGRRIPPYEFSFATGTAVDPPTAFPKYTGSA
jgi:hypothetical protein